MKLNKREDGVYELDVRGYVCPYPQLFVAQTIEKKMKPGEILEVTFDNPSSQETIKMYCNKNGHKILEFLQPKPGLFVYRIQKV